MARAAEPWLRYIRRLADCNKARFELGRVSTEDMAAARSWYLEAEIWLVEARQDKDGRAKH